MQPEVYMKKTANIVVPAEPGTTALCLRHGASLCENEHPVLYKLPVVAWQVCQPCDEAYVLPVIPHGHYVEAIQYPSGDIHGSETPYTVTTEREVLAFVEKRWANFRKIRAGEK